MEFFVFTFLEGFVGFRFGRIVDISFLVPVEKIVGLEGRRRESKERVVMRGQKSDLIKFSRKKC